MSRQRRPLEPCVAAKLAYTRRYKRNWVAPSAPTLPDGRRQRTCCVCGALFAIDGLPKRTRRCGDCRRKDGGAGIVSMPRVALPSVPSAAPSSSWWTESDAHGFTARARQELPRMQTHPKFSRQTVEGEASC